MKQGFTLIELLVVLLIIGILAAVALPQYQKAVVKSRFAEVLTNLKAIAQAQQVCYMEKGEVCSFDELSIDVGKMRDGTGYTENFGYIPHIEDVNGNPVWALAFYRKEDVCLCYLQTGEIVLNQNESVCEGD